MSYSKREPFEPTPDTVIWRYMDDVKFEDLLKRFSEHDQWQPPKPNTRTIHFNDPGQLWFGFPWSFDDDLEGTFPDQNKDTATYCDRMSTQMGLSLDEARLRKERFLTADTETLRDGVFFMAQMCGVSCWHANASESADMWSFVRERNGVAIRSTCQQVEHALAFAHNSPARRASPSLCAVGYVDHSDYFLPADGYRGLLSIIRESWSYENEVRFVAKSAALAAIPMRITTPLPLDPANWTSGVAAWAADKDRYLAEITAQLRQAHGDLICSKTKGFRLPISLKDLLLEVVLKPGCEPSYQDTVCQLLQQAGYPHVTVSRSSLI